MTEVDLVDKALQERTMKQYGKVLGTKVRVQYAIKTYCTGIIRTIKHVGFVTNFRGRFIDKYEIELRVATKDGEDIRTFVVSKLPTKVLSKIVLEKMATLKKYGMEKEVAKLEAEINDLPTIHTFDCNTRNY